jgi:hypothetical protein
MKTLVIICITAICGVAVRAQSNNTDAARWLARADLAPPFVVPASREAWEVKRQELRAELWNPTLRASILLPLSRRVGSR